MDDTDGLELGRPDAEPMASETIDGIVDLIGDLIERGHAYEAGGDVYFRVDVVPGVRQALQPRRARRCSRARTTRERPGLKESPLDFALWKAQKQGEDTAWDAPWGRGRPGWHIECSAMAERAPRPRLRHPRRRVGPRLPPPRERDRPDRGRRAARPLAALWMHNGMVRFGDEKMSKSVGNIALLTTRSTRWAATRWSCTSSAATTASRSPSRRRRCERRGARSTGSRELCRRLDASAEPAPTGSTPLRASASSTPWPTTSTRRRPARCCSSGSPRPTAASTRASRSAPARSRTCSGLLGPRRDLLEARATEAARRRRGAARRARGRPREHGLRRGRRLRDELAALGWEVRDSPPAPGAGVSPASLRRPPSRSDRLRPQRRPRSAARQARACTACWATDAARRRALARRRVDYEVADPRELEELCGSPDHQGVVRRGRGLPVRRRERAARAAPTRSCSASTRCRTRATSARSAAWPSAPAPRAS